MTYIKLLGALLISLFFYTLGYTNSSVSISALKDVITGKLRFAEVFANKQPLFVEPSNKNTFLNANKSFYDTTPEACRKANQAQYIIADYLEGYLDYGFPLGPQLSRLPLNEQDKSTFTEHYQIKLVENEQGESAYDYQVAPLPILDNS